MVVTEIKEHIEVSVISMEELVPNKAWWPTGWEAQGKNGFVSM